MADEHDGGTRRVLMLAYYFPPLGGAGVQRTLKFAKYLPESGWLPTVITTRSTVYPVTDPTLADELPRGTEVIRAREPRGAMAPAVALRRLGFERASRVAAFPDAAIGWAPDAIRLALRAVRSEAPAVLLSSSAPFTSHLVALAVHRRTGIPWVADFRDEWSANPGLRADPMIVRRCARRVEAAIGEHAARVTVVADYFELPAPADRPAVVIPNGVDEADVTDPAPSAPPDDVLRLSYVGSLYGDRDAEPVIAALDRVVRRGAIDPARFQVRIVGSDFRVGSKRPWPVDAEQIGYVSHREALRQMRTASALLHYDPPTNRGPAGKIYEYLASGRPVLCVARADGEAAALVRAAEAGPVAASDDPDGIERAILSLYERWRTTGLPEQPRVREWVLAHYSRRKLARDLASVLDAAAVPPR